MAYKITKLTLQHKVKVLKHIRKDLNYTSDSVKVAYTIYIIQPNYISILVGSV